MSWMWSPFDLETPPEPTVSGLLLRPPPGDPWGLLRLGPFGARPPIHDGALVLYWEGTPIWSGIDRAFRAASAACGDLENFDPAVHQGTLIELKDGIYVN